MPLLGRDGHEPVLYQRSREDRSELGLAKWQIVGPGPGFDCTAFVDAVTMVWAFLRQYLDSFRDVATCNILMFSKPDGVHLLALHQASLRASHSTRNLNRKAARRTRASGVNRATRKSTGKSEAAHQLQGVECRPYAQHGQRDNGEA